MSARYLLDTHVWLWLQADPDRLRPEAAELVVDTANEMFLSAASSWEIAIKYRIGKLALPEPPMTYVPDRMRRSGTTPLAVETAHALKTSELPSHHADPFDRLLVAQAHLLGIPIITADSVFEAYGVEVIGA